MARVLDAAAVDRPHCAISGPEAAGGRGALGNVGCARHEAPIPAYPQVPEKAGQVWLGYYYEPPRGVGGEPGFRPKPVALGSELLRKGEDAASRVPPPEVLAKYSEVAKVKIANTPAQGTVAAVYERWHDWAEAEVKADRLGKRTLSDYEKHWQERKPVFGAGPIDGLTQPLMLSYYDKRSSKDRAKREVAFLGLMCSWAKPRGYMRAPNPVDRGLRHQLKLRKVLKPVVPPNVYWTVLTCGDQLVRDVHARHAGQRGATRADAASRRDGG